MALITYLTKIQFDFGALALLPEALAGLGAARSYTMVCGHAAPSPASSPGSSASAPKSNWILVG